MKHSYWKLWKPTLQSRHNPKKFWIIEHSWVENRISYIYLPCTSNELFKCHSFEFMCLITFSYLINTIQFTILRYIYNIFVLLWTWNICIYYFQSLHMQILAQASISTSLVQTFRSSLLVYFFWVLLFRFSYFSTSQCHRTEIIIHTIFYTLLYITF